MRLSPFFLSSLSIKHRLPLLIGTLLFAVILASTWASHRGVKESAFEIGRERLENLTRQLANLTQQSTALLLNKTFTAANDPAIRAFLQSPSPGTRTGAAASLQQFTGSQDPNGIQVELWDANRALVLTLPDGASPVPVDLGGEFMAAALEPFKTVGSMNIVKDTIMVPAVAAVNDVSGRPTGYLVRWRRVSANPQPTQLTELLGSEAKLYFGNLRGDLLTNLERIVSQPQPAMGSTNEVLHYWRDGKRVMAMGRPIGGTPLFVVVEFPEQPFLAQANRFLRRMILVDIVLLGFGVAGAFVLSRGITKPLHSLTEAASAISVGDYSRTVDVQGKDELGWLAAGFNTMTARLRASQSELEGKVQALSDSEQRLQTVVENLNDGLVISDLNYQLLHWNRSALEMHGFASLEECKLKLPEFTKIFEISDLGGAVLNVEQWPLARIIGGEQLSDLEVRIRRLDQDWDRIFSYSGSIVREASGRPVAFLTVTDITERKRAEEESRRLALLVESSEDAIVGKTLEGTITSWNKAAERLYGYPADEVLGRPISILAPPEGADEVALILERLRQGDNIDHFETERIAKNGKRVFVSLTISPIREKSDAITGWSSSARDITESKTGEEALRNSEIRYRRLFESAHDGILILEADSGRIIDVNPYLVELLGTVKEELLGKELWELGLFQDIVASKSAFAELQERGYIRYENLPLKDREGIIRQVEFVSNSYLAGERRVIQCNIRDITERKLAEEDLRQTNERLETALSELKNKTRELAIMTQQLWQASKLATMGELAASVAHELNNPLATISLHAEALLGQLAADDPHRRAMLVIEQEVDRMASLVSNLLLFSRRSHPQVAPLDICLELTKSLELIEYSLRSHNIDIVLDCATVLPAVQADRQQLQQVFLNLITNASDAMPNGGTLTVKSREGEMAEGQTAVVVEFSDTGTGVRTGDLPKLWEPFFTTKPPGKGTGLGLAICRRTVEGHHGTIEIETGPGRGANVRITLPATDEGIEVAA